VLRAATAPHGLLEAPFFATYAANLTRLVYTSPAGERFYLIPGTTAPAPLLLNCNPPLSPSQRQARENAYAHLHPTTRIMVLETAATGHQSQGVVGPSDPRSVLAGSP
jgi:hypothetical protein